MVLECVQQVSIHPSDALFELLNMLENLRCHKAMHRTEFVRVQGLHQFLAAGAQTPFAIEHLMQGTPVDQRLDHGACRLPVDIGDHDIEPNARVGENFVQPVLLGAALAHQFLALTGDQAQLPHLCRWHEGAAQQARPGQGGQPTGIGNIGLAPGYPLGVTRVHHHGMDPHLLQRRIGALPVRARTLHDHTLRCQLPRPFRQGTTIPLESAKLALDDLDLAIVVFDDGTGGDLGLMHNPVR